MSIAEHRAIALEEFCITGSGGTPSRDNKSFYGGTIPWVKSGELREKLVVQTEESITEEALKKSSAKMVPAGAILLAMYGATVGRLAMLGVDAATNQAICNIRPDPRLADAKYVYRALESRVPELIAQATGGAQPNISQEKVRNLRITLPPLDEQKRIAAILDKADLLRQKRRQAIALLEETIDSVFWHSYSSSAKIQSILFADIALSGSGNFGNGPFGSDLLTSELQDRGVPVIYIRDIRAGEYKRVSSSFVAESKARTLFSAAVHPGDVLVSKVGDPPGVAAIYPVGEPEGIVTQDVIRIRVNETVCLKEYLRSFLNSSLGKHLIKGITVAATRARFSLRDLKSLEIPLPPVAEQATFVTHVATLEKEKRRMEFMLTQSSTLFASLQHSAFTGQL